MKAREVAEIAHLTFVPAALYKLPRLVEEAGVGRLETTFDKVSCYAMITAFELARLYMYYRMAGYEMPFVTVG